MKKYPQTVAEILNITDQPVVAIDHKGHFTFINDLFTQTYGWTKADLVGKPVTTIMPPGMREAHTRGMNHLMRTGEVRVAGKPLPLPMVYKNGDIEDAEHYILGDVHDGDWRFAALIIPPQHRHISGGLKYQS
jgi:PAS domain S-box-containing protein